MAGAGGQGIMKIGKMLSQAALNSYPHLTFFPLYGVEVRGGTSYCQVILSSDEISSPLAEKFDIMLIMNQPSADRFLQFLDRKGLAIINSTLCKAGLGQGCVKIEATKIADQLGNIRAANMVMLGTMLALKPVVPIPNMESIIRASFTGQPESALDINMRAFQEGLKFTVSPP
jgi:2-oxoglutarate ferredoxin oxidoreductase subunit gamma